MKKKELTDLRSKDLKALRKLVFDKKLEASKSKASTSSGKEKNLKVYRNLRRDIAQILSVTKEKEIVEELNKEKETK